MKVYALPLLLASILFSQDTVIKTTTRLVQINVVVHTKKGEPVTDLTKDDFTITDEGKPQTIQLFSVEKIGDSKALPPPQPGVFSNRLLPLDPARPAVTPNLTVILLDRLNTAFVDQAVARRAVIKVLAQTKPGDPVALYVLNNGVVILHDFTSQSAQLLTAMDKFRADNSALLEGSKQNADIVDAVGSAGIGRAQADPVFASLMKDAEEQTELFYIRRRVETTVAAFEAIANHLQGMAGRKSVVWISAAFPFSLNLGGPGGAGNSYDDFRDEIGRVVREFNRSNIVMYPVDARGLLGPIGIGYLASSASSRGTNDRQLLDASLQTRSSQATMLALAEKTGGKAFIERNDLETGIREAIEDARVSYVLSFAPTHNQWDGSFRKIHVEVNRKGLNVRYRNGYLAEGDLSADAQTRQRAITQAGQIPLLATGLTLDASLESSPNVAPSGPLHLKFTIDSHELTLRPNEKGEPSAFLDFLLILRDEKNAALDTVTRTLRRAVKEQDLEALQKTGLPVTLDVPHPAGLRRIRLVARDANSGLIGSVDVPVQ